MPRPLNCSSADSRRRGRCAPAEPPGFYKLDEHHRNVPDAELLADLRRVARVNRLTYQRYADVGRFAPGTVVRHFGSWNGALIRAGLSIGRHYRVPDEQCFAQLWQMWRTLGRQPRLADFENLGTTYGPALYIKRFGSWRCALGAFVEWANGRAKRRKVPTPGSEGTPDDPDSGARAKASGSSEYLRTRRGG